MWAIKEIEKNDIYIQNAKKKNVQEI